MLANKVKNKYYLDMYLFFDMIKGFCKSKAKLASLFTLCMFCCLITSSCGRKDKSIFISSNEQYNKKFKHNKNESMPMLNAIYTTSDNIDKISYYDLQTEYFEDIVATNDMYFKNMLESPEGMNYAMAKKHETITEGNAYFLQELLLKQGSTYNDDKIKYFKYLQFLIQTKSNAQNKESFDDPIDNTFNPNALSILESQKDIFKSVPIKDY